MQKEGELIILKGLEGNPRADTLSGMQVYMKDYLQIIQIAWTVLFVCTALFLIFRYILMPLYLQSRKQ